MKRILIGILCITFVLDGCSSKAQNDNDTIYKALTNEVANSKSINPKYDTIVSEGYTIIVPKLVNQKFSDVIKEDYSNSLKEKYCDGKGNVTMTYILMQNSDEFLSILKSNYFECPGMASYSISSDGLNFIIFHGALYKVSLNPTSDLLNRIKMILKEQVDPECFEDADVNRDLDLFFKKGKMFVNNPLHSKVCEDSIELEFKIADLSISPY